MSDTGMRGSKQMEQHESSLLYLLICSNGSEGKKASRSKNSLYILFVFEFCGLAASPNRAISSISPLSFLPIAKYTTNATIKSTETVEHTAMSMIMNCWKLFYLPAIVIE